MTKMNPSANKCLSYDQLFLYHFCHGKIHSLWNRIFPYEILNLALAFSYLSLLYMDLLWVETCWIEAAAPKDLEVQDGERRCPWTPDPPVSLTTVDASAGWSLKQIHLKMMHLYMNAFACDSYDLKHFYMTSKKSEDIIFVPMFADQAFSPHVRRVRRLPKNRRLHYVWLLQGHEEVWWAQQNSSEVQTPAVWGPSSGTRVCCWPRLLQLKQKLETRDIWGVLSEESKQTDVLCLQRAVKKRGGTMRKR